MVLIASTAFMLQPPIYSIPYRRSDSQHILLPMIVLVLIIVAIVAIAAIAAIAVIVAIHLSVTTVNHPRPSSLLAPSVPTPASTQCFEERWSSTPSTSSLSTWTFCGFLILLHSTACFGCYRFDRTLDQFRAQAISRLRKPSCNDNDT
jgi:hypothetical protein